MKRTERYRITFEITTPEQSDWRTWIGFNVAKALQHLPFGYKADYDTMTIARVAVPERDLEEQGANENGNNLNGETAS